MPNPIVQQVFNILSDYLPHRFDEFSRIIFGSDHLGAFNLHARISEIRNGKFDGLERTILSWMDGKMCVYVLLTPMEAQFFRGDPKSHTKETEKLYRQAKEEASRIKAEPKIEQLSLIQN